MRAREARSNSWALAVALLGACKCGGDGLQNAKSHVLVTPAALDFGNVYLQATPQLAISAVNAGEAPDTLTLTLSPGTPFTLGASSLPLGSGASQSIAVTFAPLQPGPASAVVTATWGAGSAQIALTGDGLAWPPCVASGACATAAFDPRTGQCNQQPLADGTACVSGDLCLVDTACVSGQCLGKLDSCDDGNPCTTDYCVEGQGCQHQPATTTCQGTNPCQSYGCDPVKGCVSTALPNGTPCATEETCQSAQVCFDGSCFGVSAPDGTPCKLWWASCVEDAACKGGTCDSPTADAYTPGQLLWTKPNGFWLNDTLPVDDAGTIYVLGEILDAGFPVSLIAIDACGRDLWTSPFPAGPVTGDNGAPETRAGTMITPGGVLATDYTADLAAYVPQNGAQLWERYLPTLLGWDGGYWTYYADDGSNSACSNQGQLGLSLFSISSVAVSGPADGSPLASLAIPDQLAEFNGNMFLFDAAGDSYFNGNYNNTLLDDPDWPADGGISLTGSFDPSGALRFTFWGPGGAAAYTQYFELLAMGSDYFVGSGGWLDTGPFTLMGFSLSGQQLYQLQLPGGLPRRTAAIDAAGVAYVGGECWGGAGCAVDGGYGGYLVAVSKSGVLQWQTTLPPGQFPVSGPVLAEDNLVYLVTGAVDVGADEDGGNDALDNWIVVLDTRSGALVWQAALGPSAWTEDAFLALTPAGTLIVNWYFNDTISAYFVGAHQPDPAAPWPREGGDNRNAYSVQVAGSGG